MASWGPPVRMAIACKPTLVSWLYIWSRSPLVLECSPEAREFPNRCRPRCRRDSWRWAVFVEWVQMLRRCYSCHLYSWFSFVWRLQQLLLLGLWYPLRHCCHLPSNFRWGLSCSLWFTVTNWETVFAAEFDFLCSISISITRFRKLAPATCFEIGNLTRSMSWIADMNRCHYSAQKICEHIRPSFERCRVSHGLWNQLLSFRIPRQRVSTHSWYWSLSSSPWLCFLELYLHLVRWVVSIHRES